MAGKKQSIFSVMQSVIAAFFGVQTPEKFDEDDQQVDYRPHLAVGLVFTIFLVIGIAIFVRWFVAVTMADLNG
ncbi:MAG: hypothetical protein ACI91G_000715 [Gammaproteobacteria bacterium]|jgi:hypothetical protein